MKKQGQNMEPKISPEKFLSDKALDDKSPKKMLRGVWSMPPKNWLLGTRRTAARYAP
jgi:hypothetical protein